MNKIKYFIKSEDKTWRFYPISALIHASSGPLRASEFDASLMPAVPRNRTRMERGGAGSAFLPLEGMTRRHGPRNPLIASPVGMPSLPFGVASEVPEIEGHVQRDHREVERVEGNHKGYVPGSELARHPACVAYLDDRHEAQADAFGGPGPPQLDDGHRPGGHEAYQHPDLEQIRYHFASLPAARSSRPPGPSWRRARNGSAILSRAGCMR